MTQVALIIYLHTIAYGAEDSRPSYDESAR